MTQITPTNESPEEVPVTIGSLKPINGTYFESQGLIDDETPDVEEDDGDEIETDY